MNPSTPAPGNGPAGQALQCCPFCGGNAASVDTFAWCNTEGCLAYLEEAPYDDWQRIPRLPAQALATLRREKEELRGVLKAIQFYYEKHDPETLMPEWWPRKDDCLMSISEIVRTLLARTSDDSGKERE